MGNPQHILEVLPIYEYVIFKWQKKNARTFSYAGIDTKTSGCVADRPHGMLGPLAKRQRHNATMSKNSVESRLNFVKWFDLFSDSFSSQSNIQTFKGCHATSEYFLFEYICLAMSCTERARGNLWAHTYLQHIWPITYECPYMVADICVTIYVWSYMRSHICGTIYE